MHLAQAFRHFVNPLVFQAPREGRDNLLARHAVTGWSFYREDEGKAEFGVVGGIECVQLRIFFGAAQVQARCRLLAGRFGRQCAGNCGFASQFGMGAQQRQLLVCAAHVDSRLQSLFQCGDAREWTRQCRRCRNPRRMLVNATQGCNENQRIAGVQVGQSGHGRGVKCGSMFYRCTSARAAAVT